MKIYLIFNQTSRALVSMTNDPLAFANLNNLIIKEVNLADLGLESGEFNLARFRWEGDCDTGRLVDLFKEKIAIVDQGEIDRKYYEIFFRKFPLEEVIFKLVINLGLGDPMRNFLMKLLEKKHGELEFYRASKNHIYQSEQFKEVQIAEAFKVEEAIAPQTVQEVSK